MVGDRVKAIDTNPPGGWSAITLATLDGGGFPGAVGAKHRRDGTEVGGQREPADRFEFAVADM